MAAATAPAAAAPPLSAYGALPAIEHIAVSPSGKRMALVGVLGEVRSLLIVGLDPPRRSALDDRKVRGVSFADEDRVLVSISSTERLGPGFSQDRYEFGKVVVLDLATRTSFAVFGKKENVFGGVMGNYGTMVADGRPIGLFSTISLERSSQGRSYDWKDGIPDLYRVDLQTGAIKLVGSGGDSARRRDWIVDGTGTPYAALDLNVSSGEWVLRSLKAGVDVARGRDPYGRASLVSAGRTPDTVVLATPVAAGASHYAEIDIQTGTSAPLMSDEQVAATIIDPVTKLLVGYVRDGDMPEPRFFDRVRAARMRGTAKAFAGYRTTLIDADAKFETLVVGTDGPGDSGTFWRVDIPTGKATQLGVAYPAVTGDDVAAVRMVPFVAADGLAMSGVLTLPPRRPATRLPLIVLPHGGPGARDYPKFDWWSQALASRGYAVFQPNFRGSTGLGTAFREAGDGQWGAKMQTDISDGVAALATQGIVDPRRVCIMGASYGGYAALAGVTLQNGLYRCAVSVAGVGDLRALFDHARKADGDKVTVRSWEAQIGRRADLAAISPARAAARVDAPVLLIHGRDDTVVPYQQSVEMAEKLRAAGKTFELVTLPGEDHWLSRSVTRTAMLEAAVAFVERHNPPLP